MPLADLVRALELDAAAQVRALLAGARARADEIEAAAGNGREATLAREIAASNAEYRASADDKVAAVRQRMRTTVLVARAEMLDRVRAALLAQLPAHLPRVAAALARAAQTCVGEAKYVECRVPTGVVLELDNGTQIVATLEALVEREWPRLAAAIIELAAKEETS